MFTATARTLGLGFVLSLATALSLYAQSESIKWGKIPQEQLAMKDFPADTNATAVILADVGRVSFRRGYEIVFERHRRIKILSEAAYDDWGTHDIVYRDEDRTQRVGKIKGQTFTVGPNGEAKRHKMDKDAIFTEDLDGEYERIRFTLPALEPGAVIEYRYQVQSKYPTFLESWAFQHSEPTLWSEYRAEIPDALHYVMVTLGMQEMDVNESERMVGPTGSGMAHRWAMQDVEALREEPFMTTPNDYRAQIRFQLSSYYEAGHTTQFMQTWDVVAEELMDRNDFGRRLGKGRAVRRQAEAVTVGLTDPEAKMRAIYDYLRTTIEWDGRAGFLMDQELTDVLKKKKGSSPEIALLQVAMLREVGLEAHPVLISTREHGTILDLYPLLTQFNDVLTHVKAGGKTYLLDACNPLRPYNLLPTSALNGKGLLVREKSAEWVPIETTGRYKHLSGITAELDEAGSLTGTLDASATQYGALIQRTALEEAADEETFVREVLLEDLDGVEIVAYEIENADEVDKVLDANVEFALSAYAQAAGDFIYLNPILLGRQGENPLRLPNRTFPVDLAYPRDLSYTLKLKLPDGYEVQEMPENKSVRLSSGGGKFSRFSQVEDGVLQMRMRFTLAKSRFDPRHYLELRAFFDEAVAAEQEQVVLKRTSEAAAPVAGSEAVPTGDADIQK